MDAKDRVETSAKAEHVESEPTKQLIAAAAEMATICTTNPDDWTESRQLSEFEYLYREWLLVHRGAPGDLAYRFERRSLRLLSMMGANSLSEALAISVRFSNLIWGYDILELGETDGFVIITLTDPFKPGASGLFAELWALSLVFCELEFLIGGEIDGARAAVRHPLCVPSNIIPLFFYRPLMFDAPALQLLIPKRHLQRAIVARAHEVSEFLSRSLHVSLTGGPRAPSMRALILSLLRSDRFRNRGALASFQEVSERLGYSKSTIARRLTTEGYSFRDLKKEILNETAKMWLADRTLSVHTVSERLGYSDVFSFRRSFRALNGCSPTSFRKKAAPPPPERLVQAGIS
jgi:AraC-like DNA-binding protein